MAIATGELTEHQLTVEEVVDRPVDQTSVVRLAVHDASRLEWSLSIALPTKSPVDYTLTVEIQIPQQTFVRHSPWDQMQAFTRLDGPAIAQPGDVVSIDHLRRGALAMASQLGRAFDGFARHCRLAGSLFATAPHSELEEALTIWIDVAVRLATDARARLAIPSEEIEPAEVTRERRLVDEYISVRFLEALAGAERSLSGVVQSKTMHAAKLAPVVAAVEERIAQALSNELVYRDAHGFTNADPTSPEALERYLERASRLKKHFQEVLFLEKESFQIAERAYHWVAAFVAVLASTWAFVWQLALAQRMTTATTLSSGIVTLALLAGVVYATKDRIKEIGRNWMTRGMHRVWGAERVTRYRAPARRLPGRDIIVTARESFGQAVANLPDPLNPEAGATHNVTVLTYVKRGTVVPQKQLLEQGVRRVKHVFRYDLSPMFARLDDALKPVPVLDGVTRKVRFIDAPRCYRVPIRVTAECKGETQTEQSTLVLHKRGLERLERDKDSHPSLSEINIEPI